MADHRRQPATEKTPTELRLSAAHAAVFDVRTLRSNVVKRERPERELLNDKSGGATDESTPTLLPAQLDPATVTSSTTANAPAPAPLTTFEGLDYANWGAGHPPDPNGDVGPTYYIQTVNTSIGIYLKSNGSRVAAFTFDAFMSQGNFGNLCDTDNFGDPVVLYDSFEDRWLITDFAFQLDASNNVVNPPGSFQCFAVSKTGDPVSGGWNFYSLNTAGGLGDYPKFGIWPDGIYWSVNMFDYAAGGPFQNVRVYAMNKFQMYAGDPTVQVVSFDAPSTEFTLLPSNARLQTGTPPTGSPNYFATVWNFLNVISVWKFHVDWNAISTSTFSGPFDSMMTHWWAQYSGTNFRAPTPKNSNDTLYPRLMVQNEYSNILGHGESLWDSHTVGAGNPTSNTTSAQAAVRYYQVDVTGGAVGANTTQAFTYSPDQLLYRYMPSVAVDRAGNIAIGYSTSNSTTDPAIKYAGRLIGDPVNSITQTEQLMIQGNGAQNGDCPVGTKCHRWGDYSAMTLDPDGCRFWYTNEYYNTNDLNDLTRIGSFKYQSCTAVGSGGTLSGTITVSPGSTPIAGALVALGSRTTTTNGSGVYSFSSLPAGTYPSLTVSAIGYSPASASAIAISSGGTTTMDFALSAAPQSGSFVDTSQADFQSGVPTNTDLTAMPNNVILLDAPFIDQHADDNGFGSGYGFSSTALIGQTFTPGVTGKLTRANAYIFCANCSGNNPNITLEVRTTSGGNPIMTPLGLLATSTVPGTSSGSGGFLNFSYSSPPILTAGDKYGLVIRLASNRTTGTQAWLATSGDVYAGGKRKVCSTTTCSDPTGLNANSDLVFKTYMDTGFAASGTFVSSIKDANPASGSNAAWGTISWNDTTPAGTAISFQVAASSSATGPFNFVGPDGTAGTTYSSGGSLSQFDGKRYLKYRATLTTTSGASTASLADVTIGFNDVASGKLDQTLTFNAIANKTYGDANFSINPTASSGLPVTVSVSSGPCTLSSSTSPANVHITGTGTCEITASQSGNGTYNAAPDVSQQFDIAQAATSVSSATVATTNGNPTPQFSDTVTLSAMVSAASTATGTGAFSGNLIFRINGKPVAGVGTAVSDGSPTGQVSLLLDGTVIPAGAGSYSVVAAFVPDPGSNYAASSNSAQSVSIVREGQSSIGRDGSTDLAYSGDTYVAVGASPLLRVTMSQSLAPEAADSKYVDYSAVNIYATFRLYKARCGTSCPTTPVYTSSQIKLNNSGDYATTHNAIAQTNGPSSLAGGSYLVKVDLVSNGYLLANVAFATLEVAPVVTPSIAGGGFLSADSTANDPNNAQGDFAFFTKKTSTGLRGNAVYVYRLRINVATSTANSFVTCAALSNNCRDVVVIIRSGKPKQLNTGASTSYPLTGYSVWTVRGQVIDASDGTTHYTNLEFTGGKARVDITDMASNGTTDKFGLTTYLSSGALFHQAATGPLPQSGTGSATNQTTIAGGNVTVRHP